MRGGKSSGRTAVLSALALAVVSIGACARQDNDGTDVAPDQGAQAAQNDTSRTNSAGQDAIMDSARIGARGDTMRTQTGYPQDTSASASTVTDPSRDTSVTGRDTTTMGNPQGTTSTGSTTTGQPEGSTSSGTTTTVPQGGGDVQRDREYSEGASGALGVPQGKMDDAAIMGLMDAADRADSASGALAATKGTNPDVQAYGRRMMTDHHQMRQHGQQVAKRDGITPKPPADHPILQMAERDMQQLQQAQRGEEFDRLYVSSQVTMHRQVLETARQSKQQAKSDGVKQHLASGEPKIQEHLRRAQELEKRLGGQEQTAGNQQPS